ncbi:MAG: methionyl-tRNA formyltransferase [Lachnospiraceae bacterium]|nr:methionyl-tRNA formyltransferase [Lachnospiraceae bacterium]
MKVIFMGTPDFAAAILEALTEAGHDIVCVVTGEDKKKGRGREMGYSPVKECALKHGLSVFQPHILKCEESVSYLKQFDADVYVVAAYGKILSGEILRIPRFGCINVHASLLPKYRGAAPIQWAILNGDKETGITIMQMDEGLDTGDILMQRVVGIDEEETAESLFDKLSAEGASLINEALKEIERGEIKAVKQDEAGATYAKLINKSMGALDFNKSAVVLERAVRGFYPWPGAFFEYKGKKIKVFKAEVRTEPGRLPAGCIREVTRNGIEIATGDGILNVKELQIEGKKRMDVKDFILGFRMEAGEIVGNG